MIHLTMKRLLPLNVLQSDTFFADGKDQTKGACNFKSIIRNNSDVVSISAYFGLQLY